MPGIDWKGTKVLITGLSGFVGSAIARRLCSLGADVTGIVRDINRVPSVLSDCRLLVGNICDTGFVREAVSYNEVDVVIHLGAFSIVRVSSRDPLSAYSTNVMGTLNVLEAVRTTRPEAVCVVASSDKAYGDHDVLPYVETMPLLPRNSYDTSKACMDMITQTYAQSYGLDVIVTRCSNVYGPGDMNISRLVPNSIKRCLDGRPPIVYSDVEGMEREFIFIDDVVDAYVGLVERKMSRGLDHIVYNVGGGGPLDVRHVPEVISLKMLGHQDLEVKKKPGSGFREIGRQFIDATRLEGEIGWTRRVGLGEGLDRTIEWYRRFYGDGTYL